MFENEHEKKLKSQARKFARTALPGRMKEPEPGMGSSPGDSGNKLKTHKKLTVIQVKLGLTDADINKEYKKLEAVVYDTLVDEHLKARRAKDKESLRRAEVVKGVFYQTFDVEHDDKIVGWDHKITNEDKAYKGVAFTPREKFDAVDWSTEWQGADPDKTKAALITKYMDSVHEFKFFVPGADKKVASRWAPKLKLKLKGG